jgi:hypothetical protein
MKKRTSKSASATRKTSSRFGMSARTVATASTRAKNATSGTAAEVAASVADQVRRMTPEQFQKSLVLSGIISSSGKLTSKYKR